MPTLDFKGKHHIYAHHLTVPHYAGRVKCIYIDPPYNTGSQAWVYNDNVNSPMMQEWLAQRQDLY